jgi:hypothetical protein
LWRQPFVHYYLQDVYLYFRNDFDENKSTHSFIHLRKKIDLEIVIILYYRIHANV